MTSPSILCLHPALYENCTELIYYPDTEEGYRLAAKQFKKEKEVLKSEIEYLQIEIGSLELYRVFIQTNEKPANPPILLLRLRRKIDYDYDESWIWWINQSELKIERYIQYVPMGKQHDQIPQRHLEEDNQMIDVLMEQRLNI